MSSLLEMEVGDADLARLVGMTPRWIRQRAEQGIIVRTGRNKYALGDAVQALIAHIAGSDTVEEINKARLRKLSADASISELELAKKRSEVAPIAEFERAWTSQCAHIQALMRNIPQRVVTSLIRETDERRFKAALLNEIDQALRMAAETEPDDLNDETPDDEN